MTSTIGLGPQPVSRFDGVMAALVTRPYLIPLAGYRARVRLSIDKKEYIIKTADNELELEQALKLRHEVFIVELLGKKKLFGIDMDRFDGTCDHLMVVDRLSGECVGTYRLSSDVYANDFYSATEFHLGSLLDQPGTKLEIGRACIKRDYRRGNLMGLLWEGIYAYIGAIKARYIFGCSSVMTTDRSDIAIMHRYLADSQYYRRDLGIRPRGKYAIKTLSDDVHSFAWLETSALRHEAKRLIPRLVTDYFNLGARVCGEPALDRAFKCVDLFTILDLENLNQGYREERMME